MKLSTILKASTLALDIFNHQSTQQLSGLVTKGIKRRRENVAIQPPRVQVATRARPPQQGHPRVQSQDPFSPLPVRHIAKYVTPENLKKAQEWHGIIRSFLDRD